MLFWREFYRRQAALYKYASVQSKIQNIARYIAAGGDPSANSDYQQDYWYLVGEFGEGVFESEVNRLKLMKEDGEERH